MAMAMALTMALTMTMTLAMAWLRAHLSCLVFDSSLIKLFEERRREG